MKYGHLGDFIDLAYGKGLPARERKSGPIPVFGSAGCVDTHDQAFVEGPGVIVGRKGTIGSVHWSEGDFFPIDTTYYVVSKSDQVQLRYIYYLLKTLPLQQMNTDVAVPGLNRANALRLAIAIPSLSTQERITVTLDAYDDLIENNRRRIRLLEEAARLLYREWFVHLRFPGHEHVAVVDGVPEGWERKTLSQVADFVNGFAFKPSDLGEEGFPIVKIPELKEGVTAKTPRNPGDNIPEKFFLADGDLLFSWSGTLAVNAWVGGPAFLNQHLFHVIPNGEVGRAFLMHAIHEALPTFENQTVGATMKHIRRSALDSVFTMIPIDSVLMAAEETLNLAYKQVVTLRKQNYHLATARDLLLPRLMNGEINI